MTLQFAKGGITFVSRGALFRQRLITFALRLTLPD